MAENWRTEVIEALRELGGQGTLSEIYEAVRYSTTRKLPKSWKAIIRRELEYNSSDTESYRGRYDLFYSVSGIGGGVWGLREMPAETPIATDIEQPKRVPTLTSRILRDTALARLIKKLHKDRCQICGIALELSEGATYSEAHHIQPLGTPHNGPDIAPNILVVCPNHHALLDFGAIPLRKEDLSTCPGHEVGEEFIGYHNKVIRGDGELGSEDRHNTPIKSPPNRIEDHPGRGEIQSSRSSEGIS